MKNKEQLAEEYAEGKSSSSVFREAHIRDFLAGFSAKEKQIKESLKEIQQLINEIENKSMQEQIFLTRDLNTLKAKEEILRSLL